MKNYIFPVLVLYAFFFQMASAQNGAVLNITVSEPFRDRPGRDFYTIYRTEDNNTIIARGNSMNMMFDVYDANYEPLLQEKVKKSRRESVAGSLAVGSKLKFFTIYNAKGDQRELHCYTIDGKQKSFNKKVVNTFPSESKGSIFSSYKRHNNNFAISPNGSYYAVATSNESKRSNSYTITVFTTDDDSVLYQNSYQESDDRTYQHRDMFVSNEGIVYTLGKLYDGFFKNERKIFGESNYDYILNKVSSDSSSALVLNIDADFHASTLNLIPSEETMKVVGFYSERGADNIKGTCSFIVAERINGIGIHKTIRISLAGL